MNFSSAHAEKAMRKALSTEILQRRLKLIMQGQKTA
jgi:hypothetical protein